MTKICSCTHTCTYKGVACAYRTMGNPNSMCEGCSYLKQTHVLKPLKGVDSESKTDNR